MLYRILLPVLFLLYITPDRHMLHYLDNNSPYWMSSDVARQTTIADSTLTIVSFNIKYALRLDEALRELSTYPFESADIILLQEMDEAGTIYISEKLDYNYLYFPILYNKKYQKNFGNAILSKWPITSPQKILLPHRQPLNRSRRGVTSAIIKYGDMDIKTYSIHLETPVMALPKRLEQLKSTIDDINNDVPNGLVIAGGDFNSLFPRDIEKMIGLCRRNDLDWSTETVGATFRRFHIIRPTLDHIFSKGFQFIDAGKITSSTASDHSPIWTTLKISRQCTDL